MLLAIGEHGIGHRRVMEPPRLLVAGYGIRIGGDQQAISLACEDLSAAGGDGGCGHASVSAALDLDAVQTRAVADQVRTEFVGWMEIA